MKRIKNTRGRASVTVVFFLSAAAFLVLFFAYKMHWRVQVGERLPGMTLASLDGDAIDLGAFRGRIVLLNFFATWCPACLLELDEVQKELWPRIRADDNVVFLAVSRDEPAETVEAFTRKKGFEWTFLIDEGGEAFGQVAWSGIPRILIIDRHGLIHYRHVGYRRGITAEWMTELARLRNGRQRPPAIQHRERMRDGTGSG